MWLILSALADPGPARQCAAAAVGAEIEVCLALAAEHPEATAAIALALAAHVDQASSPDRALLAALLQLLDPDAAVAGVRALDALDDPRVTGPLVQAARHRDPAVVEAAVAALARRPTARPLLLDWLLDADRPLRVRLDVADHLARSGDPVAADGLVDALRQRGLPLALRRAILAALRTHHPRRLPEVRREISRDGTAWATTTGGLTLGYAIGVAGQSASPEIRWVAAGTGALAGGTVGYLLAGGFPAEAEDAAFVTTSTLLGTGGGYLVGRGVAPGRPETALWAGLGGQAAAYGLSTALQRRHLGTELDSVEATAIALAAGALVGGVLDVGAVNGLSDPERTDARSLGAGLGLLGGAIVGPLVAPRIALERNDWALVLLATGTGAAIGQFAPLARNERGLLPVVGAASGLLGGFALAGSIDPDWDALGSGAAGAVFAGLMLGGTTLWIAPDERELIGGAILVGGAAGMGLGGLLADVDQDPIDDRDVVLATLATGWTAAHVLAINNRRTGDPLSDPGPLLVLPAATGALFSGLAPVLDVPIPHATAGLTLGLWGTYLGASTGSLVADDPVVGGIIGGDLGLATGALVLSPSIGWAPTSVALADAGGILGGAGGLVATRAVTRDPRAALVGSVSGAAVGFVGGALAGRALRRSGRLRNMALVPGDVDVAVHPSTFADGRIVGATVRVDGW
jgi:hypothetical protein